MQQAESEFEAAQTAYEANDLGGYQEHIDKARDLIQQALTLENGGSQPLPRSTVSWAQDLYAPHDLGDPRIDLVRRASRAAKKAA